jgi:hypothetical protein
MAALEYLIYDTLTGTYIESLPFRGVSFGGGPVNQAGSFQGNFDLQDPGLNNKNWQRSTAPNKNTIIIDYAGEIVWGGPISGRKETFSDQGFQLEIDGQEGWSWWSHDVQATDYSSPPYSGITGISNPNGMPYWNRPFLATGGASGATGAYGSSYVPGYGVQPYIWDPMLIGAQVIMDCLNVPNQDIWGGMEICLNGIPVREDYGANYMSQADFNFDTWAGVKTPHLLSDGSTCYVSLTFPFTSLLTLSSILSQLTALGYGVGFDAAIDFAYSNGKYSPLEATCNFSYPRRGGTVKNSFSFGEATEININLGNCHAWSFPEDGTGQANINYETGGNQDIVVVENIYTQPGNPYGGYPNTSKVTNIANLNSPNPTRLLQAMGMSDMTLYSWPPVAPTITIDMFNQECGLGAFKVGDNVMVVMPKNGSNGKTFDPRFPGGFTSEWRIVSYQGTVGDAGESLIVFTLDTPPDWNLDGQNMRQAPTLLE